MQKKCGEIGAVLELVLIGTPLNKFSRFWRLLNLFFKMFQFVIKIFCRKVLEKLEKLNVGLTFTFEENLGKFAKKSEISEKFRGHF